MGKSQIKYISVLAVVTGLTMAGQNCSKVSFTPPPPTSSSSNVDFGDPDSFDPEDLPNCGNPNYPNAKACLVFRDSFERDKLVESEDFHWKKAILDTGNNGANVDAKIEPGSHLGPIADGGRAVLFRGREGGSTHEIYLISRSFDFGDYDKLYFQFQYVPLHLEEAITLTQTGETLPESIRLDICKEDDYECGLTGNGAVERMRDAANWTRFFPNPLRFGENLNIRDYQSGDYNWHLATVDLNDYASRKKNFVFKITAAMDEGYNGNNDASSMDDGIILDNVTLIAIRN